MSTPSRGDAIYVVMGVAGSGKSLVGAALAEALGLEFIEGDLYHPAENVARMSAGIALSDADRRGWLDALAARIRDNVSAGRGLVLACSALKRAYRDLLRDRSGARRIQFVFLRGDRAIIGQRMTTRRGHYMPASLLDSQFEALEPPAPDEDAWAFDVSASPADIATAIVARASG